MDGRVFVTKVLPESQAEVDEVVLAGDILDEINGCSLRNAYSGQVGGHGGLAYLPPLLPPILPSASPTLPPGRGHAAEAEGTTAQLPPAAVAVARRGGLRATAALPEGPEGEGALLPAPARPPAQGRGGATEAAGGQVGSALAGSPPGWAGGPGVRAAPCPHYPRSPLRAAGQKLSPWPGGGGGL